MSERLVCREAVALATDYMEGALLPALARELEAHLQTCTGCRRYFRQLRLTVETLGRIARDEVTDADMDRLVAIFRRAREG